jgi:hypothetical protein
MTTRITTAVAAALFALAMSAGPGRGGEECDNVRENIEDAVQVASKLLELELADVTKKKPDDEKEKTLLRTKFCSASGEFLGVSRVYRALADECLRGSKRRQTTSSLDDSIKSLEKSIRDTCE